MSAYISRSLYEDEDEEQDQDQDEEQEVETSAPVSYTQSRGQVTNNSSSQTIIVALYRKPDTFQVKHVEKVKISPLSSKVFEHLQSSVHPPISYNMHIHFPGLMGMISPRTQLSAGFGFEVHSGESYCVNLFAQKDDKVVPRTSLYYPVLSCLVQSSTQLLYFFMFVMCRGTSVTSFE